MVQFRWRSAVTARQNDLATLPRSQASLAVSANERDWFILNAAPDLRLQIEATPALHPRNGLRSSPIAGAVLTGGDVDAVVGLLHLRERHCFAFEDSLGWEKTYPGPELPEDIVAGTRARYVEAFERLTEISFDDYLTDPEVVLS